MQVATAREMWAAEDGHVIDDCTIIVVFLEMVPVFKPRPVTIQLGQPGVLHTDLLSQEKGRRKLGEGGDGLVPSALQVRQ